MGARAADSHGAVETTLKGVAKTGEEAQAGVHAETDMDTDSELFRQSTLLVSACSFPNLTRTASRLPRKSVLLCAHDACVAHAAQQGWTARRLILRQLCRASPLVVLERRRAGSSSRIVPLRHARRLGPRRPLLSHALLRGHSAAAAHALRPTPSTAPNRSSVRRPAFSPPRAADRARRPGSGWRGARRGSKAHSHPQLQVYGVVTLWRTATCRQARSPGRGTRWSRCGRAMLATASRRWPPCGSGLRSGLASIGSAGPTRARTPSDTTNAPRRSRSPTASAETKTRPGLRRTTSSRCPWPCTWLRPWRQCGPAHRAALVWPSTALSGAAIAPHALCWGAWGSRRCTQAASHSRTGCCGTLKERGRLGAWGGACGLSTLQA